LKKHATLGNLMSIIACYTVTTMANAYVNTAIVFLLRNPNYFGINESEVGSVSSSILFWSIFFSMILAPLYGYSYELLGRKFTLCLAFCLLAGMLFMIPYCNHLTWLGICRMCMMIGSSIVMCHPLILDYVKRDSRGKATAF